MTNEATSLSVFKDASGRYRWVLFSSNAFADRVGEIVSTKALENDVDRADADGNYGPLRWWHVPGLDIGDCDFNAVHGRTLVESGTFRDEAVGAAIAKEADGLQASIGFYGTPDADGTFHQIRRFERSLLPSGRACNALTKLFVHQEEDVTTLKEKLGVFTTMLGSKEKAEQVIAEVERIEKEADTAGVAFKETTEPAPPAEGGKEETPAPTITVAGQVADPIVTNTTTGEQVPATQKELGDVPSAEAIVGEMVRSEFETMIRMALWPLIEQKVQEVMSESLTTALASGLAQKDDTDARLKEVQAQQATDAERVSRMERELAAAKTQQTKSDAALTELLGVQPSGVLKAHIASESPTTKVSADHRLKDQQPVIDPVDSFITDLLGAADQPAQ